MILVLAGVGGSLRNVVWGNKYKIYRLMQMRREFTVKDNVNNIRHLIGDTVEVAKIVNFQKIKKQALSPV